MNSGALSRPFKQNGWLPRGLDPRQLLNLRQMLEVCATEYMRIGASIQAIQDSFGVDLAIDEPVPESVYSTVKMAIANILACAHILNLAVSVNVADPVYEAYKKSPPTYHQVRDHLKMIEAALDAELQTRRFFYVEPERSDYFCTSVNPFDETMGPKLESLRPVMVAFPSVGEDLREAGSCFALDRSTATVFHLMRVLEAGLKAVGKALGVPYTKDWGHWFNDVDNWVKRGGKPDQFSQEAIAHLRAVKSVWRNTTMHVDRLYSEREAERIFSVVGAFMGHLATKLSE